MPTPSARPNKPTVSVEVKQHTHHADDFLYIFFFYFLFYFIFCHSPKLAPTWHGDAGGGLGDTSCVKTLPTERRLFFCQPVNLTTGEYGGAAESDGIQGRLIMTAICCIVRYCSCEPGRHYGSCENSCCLGLPVHPYPLHHHLLLFSPPRLRGRH